MTDKPKRQTRAQLEARIAELEEAGRDGLAVRENLRKHLAESRDREKQTRSQFDDLKTRLAQSEAEVQRMGGYIARVQEDDVVREELITTGDPAGQQQLVPKRKHEPFGEMRRVSSRNFVHDGGGYMSAESRQPPKHWVTY